MGSTQTIPESWRKEKSRHERGYTYQWVKARAAYLQEHPLCVMCEAEIPAKVTAANVVDHKTPHRGDAMLFWQRSNWQSLCKPHHDVHKQRQEAAALAGRTYTAPRGVQGDGWPV